MEKRKKLEKKIKIWKIMEILRKIWKKMENLEKNGKIEVDLKFKKYLIKL